MDNDLSISSAAVSDRGLSEKRPQNEDSFLEMPDVGIFAVADGVGGAQAGEVASQMAVEILGEAFTNLSSSSDPETTMHSAMEQANSSIFQMAHELPSLATMATTVVALHISGEIATIGHVGDSRIYRVDPSGNIFRETDDHSVVAEEVRAGRMTEEQAENHPSKNVISRALGAEGTVEPDLKTIMVEPGTSFLLCSDGITRHLSDGEIKNILANGSNLEDVCDYIKNLVYERGAEDNLTAVVVRVGKHVTPPREQSTEEMPALDTLATDREESTISTARPRSPFESKADDDELLELETGDLKPLVTNETIVHEARRTESDVTPQQIEDIALADANETAADPGFSMFGSTLAEPHADERRSSGIGGLVPFIAGLILGAAVGFGVYYFVLAPKQVPTPVGGQLSEMRSANIPLSAFEENRRNVDRDPASWVSRYGTKPEDCEDYYLLGRAYFNLGDFEKARTAFAKSRELLPGEDEMSRRTIASDIATALVAMTGTTSETMMKKELDLIQRPSNSSSSSNANAASNPASNR